MPFRHLAALLAAATSTGPAVAASPSAVPPKVVGTCAFTTVKRVETRLEEGNGRPVPDSGSAIVLANGVYGVSYDRVPAVERSRAGDRVMTCLVSVPRHCPPGDRRGKWYTSTNLRTNEAWSLPDAEHGCGGA
jgi:hypothetical protein